MLSQTNRIVLLMTTAMLLPLLPFIVIGELPGERWLSARDENAILFAVTGSSLLLADVLLPVPSSIVVALLGTRLGIVVGWVSAWIGLTLGNMLGYYLGRLWPKKLAPELPQSPTLAALFVSRPVPIFAEATVIAAGATRTNPLLVLAACATSNVIYTGILAASGAALFAEDINFITLFVPLLVPAISWLIWHKIKAV